MGKQRYEIIRRGMVLLLAISVAVISLSAQASPANQIQSNGQNSTTVVTNQKSAYKNGQRNEPNGTSELFGFPADQSTIEAKQNARNRTPVYIPNRCLENEILYPGDQEADWVCDCKPTFVYHPPTRKCYEMYTQGYCEDGFMIYLHPDEKYPECIRNNCSDIKPPNSNASMVRYKGICVPLNDYHANCAVGKIKRVVAINEKTHELECLDISVVKVETSTTEPTKRSAPSPKDSVPKRPQS